MADIKEYKTVERTADLTARLFSGESFRVSDIAREYGITRQTAHWLIQKINGVIPLKKEHMVWSLDRN